MKLKMYPVLSKEFSLSKVITEEGDNTVIYNTTTKAKAHPNSATYEFAKRCRGDKPLHEIIADLSRMSGEKPEEIRKSLQGLIKTMEDNNMLSFMSAPLHPPRFQPGEPELFRRITSIIFEITNRCNLRCKHCYNDSGAKRNNELTFEEIRDLIDNFADIGVLNIVLSGGEPLMYPHFLDIVEQIRSKPMSCIVFTNGTLITKKIVQKFKELGILSVATSIDGATPETNDSFRGVPGSFEKTVKAIEMLKEAEIPVRVNISLHKGNLNEFSGVLAFLKKWEITDYSISPISYTGRAKELDSVITPEEYKKVVEQLKEYETAEKIKNEFPYIPQLTNCGAGRNSLTIRSNGSVVPCPPFPDEASLGSIREDSISNIWNNSEFLDKIRRVNISENKMCRECTHIKVCQGGCMANNYRNTGDLGRGDPYECAYFEVYNDYTLVEVKGQRQLSVEIR